MNKHRFTHNLPTVATTLYRVCATARNGNALEEVVVTANKMGTTTVQELPSAGQHLRVVLNPGVG
ncbi:MAG: hypothetical protein ACK5HY_10225 [Parahaliea sp.]